MSVVKISIHAPRAGSDARTLLPQTVRIGFQSTLPVRGATGIAIERSKTKKEFQSTLPVRGATVDAWIPEENMRISIHAPRAGSDGCK